MRLRSSEVVSHGSVPAAAVRPSVSVGVGRPLTWAARLGLATRGLVYVVMGLMAVLVARGGHAEVDQQGALGQVAQRPFGQLLVAVMATGLAGYAVWRLKEAVFGVPGSRNVIGARLRSLAGFGAYASFAPTAVALLHGSRTSQAAQQQALTARLMQHPWGRWVVAVIGLAIVVIGVGLAAEAASQRFMHKIPPDTVPVRVRTGGRTLGTIGGVSRGPVFALGGVLAVAAAWTYDPARASGLDGAVKMLRDQPYGSAILLLAGSGLAAFGVYGLAEARYRRV